MIFLSTMSMTEPVTRLPSFSVNVVWKNWPLIVADGSRMDCRMKSRVYFEPTAVRSGASPVPSDSDPNA